MMSLAPPECVRGMKRLKKGEFTTSFKIPAIKVKGRHCSVLLKKLNKCLLNLPRFKNIVSDTTGDTEKKIILLNTETALNSEQDKLLESCDCEKTEYKVVLDYNYWSCEQVLRAVLPQDIAEVTTAFETIGHIAHMNLRDTQLEYKALIGQVILDKNSPQIKTVVNKINTIDETYRFFKMELLAGDDTMIATTKEHGCIFTFDFSKVYWNSRLQSEHKRLVDLFKPCDIICDMFAGVGPFAVPAAKKGCVVYANDLNPESFLALQKNCKRNHVEDKVHCFNMDARVFVQDLIKKAVQFNHVILNLPASAVQFLDVFKHCYTTETNVLTLPTFHCYCFSKAEDFLSDAQKQVENVFGVDNLGECCVYHVRNVAPKKMMLCVSFQLSNHMLMADTSPCTTKTREETCETSPKRLKLSNTS